MNGNTVAVVVLGIILQVLAVTVYLGWRDMKREIEFLKKTTIQLELVNEQNQRAINELVEARERDEETMRQVEEDAQEVRRVIGFQRDTIRLVEVEDDDVSSFLRTPIPEPLRRVLNQPTAAPDSDQGGSGGSPNGSDGL